MLERYAMNCSNLAMAALTMFLFSALLLTGCGQEPSEVGVVARVNGQAIYLNQLEAKYDLSHLGWSGSVSPSLGKLKADYNRILSELIAQELIFQVLEEKGNPVTREEMLQAEAAVRQDYPKGMFEQVLVEEYIDLDVWREQLRAHLAYEKLLNTILRQRVTVSAEEIERYYAQHREEFNVPARVRFLLLTGADKNTVAKAVAQYEETRDAEGLIREYPGLKMQEMQVLEDRLTRKWRGALAGVAENEGTEALAAQQGAEALILFERSQAQQLSPSDAAPIIEKQLLERKLHKAFTEWLENELADADIFVSQQLLASDDEESGLPAVESLQPADETYQAPGSAAPLGDESPLEEGEALEEPPASGTGSDTSGLEPGTAV